MKRNKRHSRVMRHKRAGDLHASGTSKYAMKQDSGRQLYGGRGADSCCAHTHKARDQ